MDPTEDASPTPQRGDDTFGEFLLAPAAILEGLPDAVVASARDGRIVFVNALAEELFGYPREELLGRPVQMLWPERLRERYIAQHTAVLRYRASVAVLHRGLGAAAAWLGVRRRDELGDRETIGGPLLLAVGRDISERRAAEARLAGGGSDGRARAGRRGSGGPRRRGGQADADHLASRRRRSAARRRCRARIGRADGGGGHAAADRHRRRVDCRAGARARWRGDETCARGGRTRSPPRWRGCAGRSACATRRFTTR